MSRRRQRSGSAGDHRHGGIRVTRRRASSTNRAAELSEGAGEAAPASDAQLNSRRRRRAGAHLDGPAEAEAPPSSSRLGQHRKRVRLTSKTPRSRTDYDIEQSQGDLPSPVPYSSGGAAGHSREPRALQSTARSAAAGTEMVHEPLSGRGTGHSRVITGHIAWCQRCGHHAERRVGVGLLRQCQGAPAPSVVSRLARLREGRHPITDQKI